MSHNFPYTNIKGYCTDIVVQHSTEWWSFTKKLYNKAKVVERFHVRERRSCNSEFVCFNTFNERQVFKSSSVLHNKELEINFKLLITYLSLIEGVSNSEVIVGLFKALVTKYCDLDYNWASFNDLDEWELLELPQLSDEDEDMCWWTWWWEWQVIKWEGKQDFGICKTVSSR